MVKIISPIELFFFTVTILLVAGLAVFVGLATPASGSSIFDDDSAPSDRPMQKTVPATPSRPAPRVTPPPSSPVIPDAPKATPVAPNPAESKPVPDGIASTQALDIPSIQIQIAAAKAVVLSKLKSDPVYIAAVAAMADLQSKLDAARKNGTTQDRLDASAAWNKARTEVELLERAANQKNAEVSRLEAMLAANAPQAETKKENPSPPSLRSLLRKVPVGDRPDPKHGWDEFSAPKVRKLLKDALVDKKVSQVVTIKTINIIRLVDERNETTGWNVDLTFDATRFQAFGFDQWGWVLPRIKRSDGGMSWGPNMTLSVTEDEARAVRDWRSGDQMQISGIVGDIEIKERQDMYLGNPPEGICSVILDDVVCDQPPNTTARKKYVPPNNVDDTPKFGRVIPSGRIR